MVSFTYRLLYLTKAKAREILDSRHPTQINRSNESSEFVTRIEVLYKLLSLDQRTTIRGRGVNLNLDVVCSVVIGATKLILKEYVVTLLGLHDFLELI